ncbi:hypothetical protein KGQ20_39485 [Catenulispora sp. NF23]|uniref:hypothetical protein n=1 Tax=Catenulispora pinistramenti TaxID=2705254 RepID=UPI001BAB1698|nr:hypothetical protein [Catenulispora pinistramenti]MBS2538847.1 hypothetical protein [Catenulispora pinistramenti]
MNANTPGTPQSPSSVHPLVTAVQAAHDDYTAAENRWPRARLVMWSSAAAAIALDIAGVRGAGSWIPATLPVPGLVFAGICILRMHRAKVAEKQAEQALNSLHVFAGLPDDALAQMIRTADHLSQVQALIQQTATAAEAIAPASRAHHDDAREGSDGSA